MKKARLEAFSDGVIAIIITVMILGMQPPDLPSFRALLSIKHAFISYVLSFIYLAIYWNNHHHLLHATQKVSGKILWANLHLLFWLSLIPFVTSWLGQNHFASHPMVLYGFILLMAAIAYFILTQSLIRFHGKDSTLARAIGSDTKGLVSVFLYAIALPLAFVFAWGAFFIYVLVAALWIVPDKRIEEKVDD